MQARTLEELELQQPFFERTIRPLAMRLSGIGQRFTSTKKVRGTERRLAMAGNPYDMRSVDFLGLKVVVAGAVAGVLFLLFGIIGRNLPLRPHARRRGRRHRLHRARVLAQPAHQASARRPSC